MFRFQNWKVYEDARGLRLVIAKQIQSFPAEERFGLSDQLRRAMNSVILNIAEGSYRKTDKDFAHFLNQASASVYECVACIDLALDSNFIGSELHSTLLSRLEELAKQITGLSKSLK